MEEKDKKEHEEQEAMSWGKLAVIILIMLICFVALQKANPDFSDEGAFFLSFLITAATYDWIAGKLNVK